MTASPAVDLVSALSQTRLLTAVPPPARRRRDGPRVQRGAFAAALLVVAAVTAALRLFNQSQSYELFMDEIQYADVANSFVRGQGPELFGDSFFLHPPLLFGYLAALQGPGLPYMTMEHVLGLRPLMVVFGAVNSVLVVLIARRLTGRRIALLAGLLYAVDPFIVRFDSRVMLEAPTLTATLAGLAAGLVAVASTGRRRTVLLVLAGIAFGIAVTTKSTSALVTTVPLLLMCAFSSGPRRREAAGMIAVQCSVYGCYVVWATATGRFGEWFGQTLSGVLRATAHPETGFTAAGSPTLIDRLIIRLTQFGPSYLLIGAAVLAIAVLVFEDVRSRGRVGRHSLFSDDAVVRMLTCWLGGVLLAIGYTAGFGELEEQTFYLMAVPSTVVIALLVARMHDRRGRIALGVAVGAVLLWSSQAWLNVHTVPDDGYRRVIEHLAPLAGSGKIIALGEYTGQFVLPGFGLVGLDGATPPPGADLVLVSTHLSEAKLAPITTEDIAELDRRYELAFVAGGRSSGELRLYDVTRGPG